MLALSRGRYLARPAAGHADLRRAQELRWLAFHARRAGSGVSGLDADRFDGACSHMLIEEAESGALVGCFRFLTLASGREIGRSYSAQFYELSALEGFAGPMVEMGRFCIHPERRDPDILRVAWGALTRHVDRAGIEMLFGCCSFHGTEPEAYLDTFAMLKERHLAPQRWLPRVKAASVYRFAQRLARREPDARRAMLQMPPLLRTYLLMGGWVSDHAVVDREMDTLHVFTGLEIGAIPARRVQALRAVAG
ncbi:GNAT family N-acetyltransferase [Cereibacter johrii]|uniref:GNAT family N-acetyltransferase n=1 Tax=Cereibacter johrii TaxID=445629 RepID=UPI000DCC5146|nr:GNAT family N-acetyltransferase [Cereibacter johrii]RAZ88078.1 ornithine-acyl-ACP acyltransferase [Cereibacter johrii]